MNLILIELCILNMENMFVTDEINFSDDAEEVKQDAVCETLLACN